MIIVDYCIICSYQSSTSRIDRCLARNSSVIIDLQDNYPIMTSPEELSGKTAVLCAEGYLESSQIQDADSNTFMGIRDM